MAFPRVPTTNLNVRELTKKFEVNATVTQEPVSVCDRQKPAENKVNIHRTHAFRLKPQNGENDSPACAPKTAYAIGKRVRKVEDIQSVKSIVEKFDGSHVVPTPEKIFKDEYSKVLKKSPSCAFDGKSPASPKINTLRKTVSNINSTGSLGEEGQQDVEKPPFKHEPLQELIDRLNTNNNNVNTSELTNSLKAALKSPLPKGPPPKKPPRTFAHKNECKERGAVMTESLRKLVKLKEMVEGGKQSGGEVVLRAKSPILPRRTKEQATSIGCKPAQPSEARNGRLVGPAPFGGLMPGKLAMFRLCTACLSGGTTVRRGDYQELRREDVVVPEEHIYDVPFQSTTKTDISKWSPTEFHCCKEKGLHYLSALKLDLVSLEKGVRGRRH